MFSYVYDFSLETGDETHSFTYIETCSQTAGLKHHSFCIAPDQSSALIAAARTDASCMSSSEDFTSATRPF